MSELRLVYEPFRSYSEMIDILGSRPNNKHMESEHASEKKGQKDWYGTSSYNEAVKMLSSGYLEVVGKLKKNVEGQSKLNAKYFSSVDHPVPHNALAGFIPNVPNAIRGIPQSMISVDRKPMKRKTVHLIYIVTGSSSRNQSYFEDAGTALLSAVDLIEKSGIQTKIDLCFFAGECSGEVYMPCVCIKNYGERFSIQKVSFPIAHTSMFRRIGFKAIETAPGITVHYSAYGHPLDDDQAEEMGSRIKEPNTYVLSVPWIQNRQCDVSQILKKLEMI